MLRDRNTASQRRSCNCHTVPMLEETFCIKQRKSRDIMAKTANFKFEQLSVSFSEYLAFL